VKLLANTETPYDAWYASACARADTASAARITLAICSGEHSPRTMAPRSQACVHRHLVRDNEFFSRRPNVLGHRISCAVNAAAKGSRGRAPTLASALPESRRGCLIAALVEIDKTAG